MEQILAAIELFWGEHSEAIGSFILLFLCFISVVIIFFLCFIIRHIKNLSWRTAADAATFQQHIDYHTNTLQTQQNEKMMEMSASISLAFRQYIDDKLLSTVETITRELSRVMDSDKVNGALKADLKTAIYEAADSKQAAQKSEKILEQQMVYLHDKFTEMQSSLSMGQEAISDLHSKIAELQSVVFAPAPVQDDALTNAAFVEKLTAQSQQDRALLQESIAETSRVISQSVDRLTGEVDAKLDLLSIKLRDHFKDGVSESMAETVSSFHALREQIDIFIEGSRDFDNIGRDINLLSRMVIAADKNEISHGRLAELLSTTLPDDAYELNGKVNGHLAAALLKLPGNEGIIAIDNDVPLGDVKAIMEDSEMIGARREFDYTLRAHINYVADTFISPPETSEVAILFISSEIIFSEIQAHFRSAVDLAMQRRVWLISPTSLIAILNMARGTIKDYQARLQLQHLRSVMENILKEAQHFENRLIEIGDYVGQAMRSVQRAENASAQFFGQVRGAAGKSIANIDIKDTPPPSDG